MRALLLALPALLAVSGAAAQTLGSSPTLRRLEGEAAKDPAGSGSAESSRANASVGFSGEDSSGGLSVQTLDPVGYKDPNGAGAANQPSGGSGNPTYHFQGTSPIKGVNIYTPVLEQGGQGGSTQKPEPKGLVSSWIPWTTMGLGAGSAIAGGIVLGVTTGPVGLAVGAGLLLLGGIAIGIGAALAWLNHKAKAG